MNRAAGLVLGTLALALQLGCLIWPFPTGELLSGRGRITPQYTAPLKVGQTTREDVLLRLGEPDEVLEGGRVLVYRWMEARGYFILATYGSGVAIPFRAHRAVRLEFGPDARLVRLGFEKGEPDPAAEPGPPAKP
ncbi:MAG: hypothetical protein WAS25_07460 [Geothrix sp.]|uniref:hypothetical protein n=1 Tax=Geothrix sp. TaxID=1962974 RepID=UPI003BB183D0